jgi:hypothetical protein
MADARRRRVHQLKSIAQQGLADYCRAASNKAYVNKNISVDAGSYRQGPTAQP